MHAYVCLYTMHIFVQTQVFYFNKGKEMLESKRLPTLRNQVNLGLDVNGAPKTGVLKKGLITL